jgi:hypothetical protein
MPRREVHRVEPRLILSLDCSRHSTVAIASICFGTSAPFHPGPDYPDQLGEGLPQAPTARTALVNYGTDRPYHTRRDHTIQLLVGWGSRHSIAGRIGTFNCGKDRVDQIWEGSAPLRKVRPEYRMCRTDYCGRDHPNQL